MKIFTKRSIKNGINHLLEPAGFELVRSMRSDRPIDEYIPFANTITGAKKANLSVSDYIDREHAGVGTTPKTIQTLCEMDVLNHSVKRISEIGPGSGRYLEKVIAICQPDYYEIYETADEWRNYPLSTYHVVAQNCDYWTMCPTPRESMDLVHAHRVFTSIPTMITYSYLLEMARVVRTGGWAVFDIFTEECMDEPTALKTIANHTIHPHLFPKKMVIELLTAHGLTFQHSFFIDLGPARTEYLVFKK